MSEAWSTALIGFISALLGAAVAAAVSLRQQRLDAERERAGREEEREARRRERAEDRERRRQDSSREARVVARLLQADTETCRRRLARAAEINKWWTQNYSLPLEGWPVYREQVARHMPIESWRQVSAWFSTATSIEGTVRNARLQNSDTLRPALTDVTRISVVSAIERADEALAALEAFTGDELPPDSAEDAGGNDVGS